jgi:hypothetical protein
MEMVMPMLKTSLFVAAVAASVLFLAPIPAAFAHHHHDDGGGGGPSGADPVHGAGSSHNPIIYHPVHGPGSSHNPVTAPVVRDHRRPQPRPSPIAQRCRRHWNEPYCNVHDHRTPPPIPCYGDLC